MSELSVARMRKAEIHLPDSPYRRIATRTRSYVVITVHKLLFVGALFLLWQFSSYQGWINSQIFSSPASVLHAVLQQMVSGALADAVYASLSRVIVGVSIAGVLGISLGALLARYERLAFYTLPLIDLLRPISVIAWIPLAIIWFGLGDSASWFIIALGAFFPVFTNTFSAIKRIPKVYLQAAQTMGLNKKLLLFRVLLPAALPEILSGIRIGLGVGWMCVIAAEMISATSGLGYMIQTARMMIETEQVFAGMIIIGVVGFLMNWFMLMAETMMTPWQHRGR